MTEVQRAEISGEGVKCSWSSTSSFRSCANKIIPIICYNIEIFTYF